MILLFTIIILKSLKWVVKESWRPLKSNKRKDGKSFRSQRTLLQIIKGTRKTIMD